jgi:hypothetical protein
MPNNDESYISVIRLTEDLHSIYIRNGFQKVYSSYMHINNECTNAKLFLLYM